MVRVHLGLPVDNSIKLLFTKVSLVTFLLKESNMLIENRIKKMKRTDSCIKYDFLLIEEVIEKNLLEIKGFSVQVYG